MGTARIPESREQSISRVFDNLRRIVKVLYSHSKAVERSAELTLPQSWLMSVLAKSEPARVFELARNMHLNPATVTRIVDRLEIRGLVVRTHPAENQRSVKMALTHKGMKLAEKLPAVPQIAMLTGLRDLPEERLRAISAGLETLVNILGARKNTPRLFFSPVSNDLDDHRAGRRSAGFG
jgi:DNA-binding MarR family transcriptional regulator